MNGYSAIQSVAWETGLQAIKDSADFDSFDVFVRHLQDGIRQNSEATRRRYTNLIVKRLFPDHKLDGINTRAWRAYADEAILVDLVRVATLEAEPVTARFVFEQILTYLRRRNYQTHVSARVDFAGITGRNQDAIRKVTAGLLKLVFPRRTDETLTEEELDRCLSVAVECRERVLAQLAVMAPGEFSAGKLQVRGRSDG